MDGVLVVTGASRGIGAATALLGSQRGYRVCVNYVRDARAANGVADAIRRAGGEAIVVQADIGHEAEVARLFATVDRTLGTVTALVNNAGILETQCRIEDVDEERLMRILRVNVVGTFLPSREAVRRMSTRRGGKGGVIVNV